MADAPSSIAGVILAGGKSSRMGGGDKCLLPLGGRPLLAHLVDRLRPQLGHLILNANGDPARFAEFALPVIPDPISGQPGPLAGILAGMRWAEAHLPEARWVATAASDTPFPPPDLIHRLSRVEAPIAVARSAGRIHPVFGLFAVSLAADLDRFLRSSETRKVTAWLDRHRAVPVDFHDSYGPLDPFFNINAPEDLRRAEAAVSERPLRPT